MQLPTGSVPALSSASSTVFSIGIVFLGYWGVHESARWHAGDVLVAALALAGFLCLGAVPWLATAPIEHADDQRMLRLARHAFLAGVTAMWLAVVASLFA
jgi:hypothetical protein